MIRKYNVQTKNSIYLIEERDGKWYIQKVWPETDNKEFAIRAFTTEERVFGDVRKDLKSALKNAGTYRYSSPFEIGAYILHDGGCTSSIRAVKEVKMAA